MSLLLSLRCSCSPEIQAVAPAWVHARMEFVCNLLLLGVQRRLLGRPTETLARAAQPLGGGSCGLSLP